MANYKVQLNPETNAYDVTRGRSIYGTIPAEEMQNLFPAINSESVITAEGLDESDKANSVRIAVTVDGETCPVEVFAKKDAPEGSETKDPDEGGETKDPDEGGETKDPDEGGETKPTSNPDVIAEIRRRRGKTSTQIRRNMVEERRAKVANPNDSKSVLEYRRNNRK